MENLNIPLLAPRNITCRVAQYYKGKDAQGNEVVTSVGVLLYKDARVDQEILDKVVGPFRWQRRQDVVNGNLFCTVSIYDPELKEWVSKQDVGVPSDTEAEKGEASDAFKRACFNWGIGRELYSAPTIKIKVADKDFFKTKYTMTFRVHSIGYDENREITDLEIVDKWGNLRWQMKNREVVKIVNDYQAPSPTPAPAPAPQPEQKPKKKPVLTEGCAKWQAAIDWLSGGHTIAEAREHYEIDDKTAETLQNILDFKKEIIDNDNEQ